MECWGTWATLMIQRQYLLRRRTSYAWRWWWRNVCIWGSVWEWNDCPFHEFLEMIVCPNCRSQKVLVVSGPIVLATLVVKSPIWPQGSQIPFAAWVHWPHGSHKWCIQLDSVGMDVSGCWESAFLSVRIPFGWVAMRSHLKSCTAIIARRLQNAVSIMMVLLSRLSISPRPVLWAFPPLFVDDDDDLKMVVTTYSISFSSSFTSLWTLHLVAGPPFQLLSRTSLKRCMNGRAAVSGYVAASNRSWSGV